MPEHSSVLLDPRSFPTGSPCGANRGKFSVSARSNQPLGRRDDPRSISPNGDRLTPPEPHSSLIAPFALSDIPQDFRDVDPRELRLPSRRRADPFNLQTQIARFGASSAGMPAPWTYKA